MKRGRAKRWLFVGSLLVALFLPLLPLPPALLPFKPYWPALVLVYWILQSPGRVNLGLAFLLGLGADLLDGVLLGDQALRLTVIAFLVLRARSRLRFLPMWQQVLAVWVLLLNNRFLQLVISLFAGESLPPPSYWLAPCVGAVFWPLVFLLLDDLHTRLRMRET